MSTKAANKKMQTERIKQVSVPMQTNKSNMTADKTSCSKSSSFWGLCCESGKKYSQVVRDKIHVTMATLDSTIVPTSPVVSLMVDSAIEGGKPYILCNLKPGSLLQVNLNLLFDKGEKVTFSLKGQGQVHLSGYHIFDKEDNVSSDAVEQAILSPINKTGTSPSKLQSPVKDKSHDKAVMNQSGGMKKSSMKASVKETSNKKALKKKSKDESDDEDSEDYEDLFEELEESSEDDESEEESDDNDKAELQKDSNRLINYKRLYSEINPSEEEESDSDESDKVIESISYKKLKKDIASFSPNKKSKNETPAKSTEVIDLDDEPKFSKKTPKTKDDQLNSSIGKTPMPQKKNSKMNLSNNLTPKKVSFDVDEESSDSDKEMDVSHNASPSKQGQLTPPTSESKKKKKKKKKASLNTSNASDASPSNAAKSGLASATYSQKLPGGLEYEDIRPGNGPLAKKGRLVHVYYTGMLENNKVFDSREIGNKPFSFKLGADQVIKGWDMAIEGMKVGGKRRMKIPASLGYKNQRMGPIPPNSTLYFNVELKAVS